MRSAPLSRLRSDGELSAGVSGRGLIGGLVQLLPAPLLDAVVFDALGEQLWRLVRPAGPVLLCVKPGADK